MYHSIQFGDKNTWEDWFIVPNEFPRFTPPEPKTTVIEIPGADGSLDLTEALTGDVKFKDRTGSLEFYAYNDNNPWFHKYTELINYLHGQRLQVVFEDDPAYYWLGRFKVNEWKSNPPTSIVIDYTVEPYKYENIDKTYRWKWDPHNFDTDLCRDYGREYVIDGVKNLYFQGSRRKTAPVITAEIAEGDTLVLLYNEQLYPLYNGDNVYTAITPPNTLNRFIFSGKGKVRIKYTGGLL